MLKCEVHWSFCKISQMCPDSLTHSLDPLHSCWNIGRPLVPTTWHYFEQCASLPATWAVSPPTLPFLCTSRCTADTCLKIAYNSCHVASMHSGLKVFYSVCVHKKFIWLKKEFFFQDIHHSRNSTKTQNISMLCC